MTFIFLDTNILLHFKIFDQINWLEESSLKKCTLVISPIITDELDLKKIGTNKISNRARKAIQKIEEIDESSKFEIRPNVFFKELFEKPLASIYEENNLNYNEQDHRLFASIIQFRSSTGNNDILICSYDGGVRRRARQFGIGILKLNDKYLLPEEESELEKKVRLLERENLALKSRIPNLKFTFKGLKNSIQFEIPKQISTKSEDFISERMINLRKLYPPLIVEENQIEDNYIQRIQKAMNSLTESQIQNYNIDLGEFFQNYEAYLFKTLKFIEREKRSFNINFSLLNDGNFPAEDIDVHLYFPDGFTLIESKKKARKPKEPVPPYKPKGKMDLGPIAFFNPPSINSFGNLDSLSENSPTIKETNSYNVDYHFNNLKHNYAEELVGLTIIFKNIDEIKNFEIEYSLSAANIPDVIKGKLNVLFKM